MASMGRGLIALWILFLVCPRGILAATEYARRCEQVIGVAVPDIDCDDPRASEVPVGTREQGLCDRPSHGGSNCNPGTKFLRYTDTFVRNGREEKVTTMVICRKTDLDTLSDSRTSNVYSDIGIIQYNETKHASCWYSATATTPGTQRPPKRVVVNGVERLVYPSPSTEEGRGNFWGSPPRDTCVRCHQNGVWLRSPFAKGVEPQAGKGYTRNGGTGNYSPGSGNNVPENSGAIMKRGIPCSVDLPRWNLPGGDEAPFPVIINAIAYDRKVPPKPNEVGSAASNSCTRCHSMGVGPLKIDYLGRPSYGLNCDRLVPEFLTGGHPGRRAASSTPRFSMPPGNTIESPELYLAQYGRAIRALQWCCRPQSRNDRDFREICGGQFEGTGDRIRELNALNGPRGSCALCPDCIPTSAGRQSAGRGPGTTH